MVCTFAPTTRYEGRGGESGGVHPGLGGYAPQSPPFGWGPLDVGEFTAALVRQATAWSTRRWFYGGKTFAKRRFLYTGYRGSSISKRRQSIV